MGEDGGAALQAKGARPACYVTVFVDGVKIFQPPATTANPAPDFDKMNVNEYAAAEFYPGGALDPGPVQRDRRRMRNARCSGRGNGRSARRGLPSQPLC